MDTAGYDASSDVGEFSTANSSLAEDMANYLNERSWWLPSHVLSKAIRRKSANHLPLPILPEKTKNHIKGISVKLPRWMDTWRERGRGGRTAAAAEEGAWELGS